MSPQTDGILARAVNISVGVVDNGIGAATGINIASDDAEFEQMGEQLDGIIRAL